MPLNLIALAAVMIVSGTPQTAAKSAFAPVNVFGRILLDFEKEKFRASLLDSSLEDCSSSESFCLSSGPVSFVIPRSCTEAQSQLKRGILGSMAVRGSYVVPLDGHYLSPDINVYYLVNRERPSTVLHYSEEVGIIAISVDHLLKVDVFDVEGFKAFGPQVPSNPGRLALHDKITLDPVAACDRP